MFCGIFKFTGAFSRNLPFYVAVRTKELISNSGT